MMKIVLGGSRKLAFMPEEVVLRLEDYINKDAEFLVGDAPGIDTKFQELLKARNYKKVTILSSADYIRNNLGNWDTRYIDSGLKSKNHARHGAKDRVMTTEANAGVMVWDKESAGTLANVIDLVIAGKPCLLYIAGDNELTNIETVSTLEHALTQFDEVASEAQKRLNAYDRRQNKKVQLDLPESLFD
jgi:hypothetical protein